MSKNPLIRAGMHTSISGGLYKAIEAAVKVGGNTLQIFSRNPRGWAARPLSTEEIEKFHKAHIESGLTPLVIHACYLINLAAEEPIIREKSISAFRDEIERAIRIGADYLVVHPGCARSTTIEHGIEICADAIKRASTGLNFGKLMILIENTAGQGSSIGCSFKQVEEILNQCNGLPIGVCVDTAHSFASGYNLITADGFNGFVKDIVSTFGFSRIKVIHCNDSKAKLGSRVDRHWHIGEGEIGRDGFQNLLGRSEFHSIPFILETPIDKLHDDKWNLEQFRAIAREVVDKVELELK